MSSAFNSVIQINENVGNMPMKAVVYRTDDLRTRKAGLYTFIQVHIELDPAMALSRAHQVSDEVERELCQAFDKAEVIIHQDPAGLEGVPERSATAGNS